MKGMFRNWTIGKKLTGAFALMSILVAMVGVIGTLDVGRVRTLTGASICDDDVYVKVTTRL